MSVFTVDTDAVQGAQSSTHATMERLQSESANLMAQLTQLTSSWTGDASMAFQECSEQWRAAQMHVEQVLASISRALASTASQYREADEFSTRLFRCDSPFV